MELIEEHNESFETNYKTIEDFNKGEEYRKEREHYLFENLTHNTEVSTNRNSLLEEEDLLLLSS